MGGMCSNVKVDLCVANGLEFSNFEQRGAKNSHPSSSLLTTRIFLLISDFKDLNGYKK
jgi:hypothetical protein